MAHEFADLFIDKRLHARVLARFQMVIAKSFEEDKSRPTMSEARRRFKMCEDTFRDLKAVGFAHARILDELAIALRSKLDGGKWEPDTKRNSWSTTVE